MSRPRYWWYDYVKKAVIHNICSAQPPETLQNAITQTALKKALADTKRQPRGIERLELVDLVLRRQKYTLTGAALVMHISEGTAIIWQREFLYTVADYMGFCGHTLTETPWA